MAATVFLVSVNPSPMFVAMAFSSLSCAPILRHWK